jgi:phosphatidylglycerophosphate synthase
MNRISRARWCWFWIAQGLSIGRVILTFLFVVTVTIPKYANAAAAIYGLAVVTDIFDGPAARRGRVSTRFGAAMDLFGDRYLTVISCLYAGFRGIDFIPLSFIILRELFSAIMRIVQIDGDVVLGVNRNIGKIILGILWITTFLLILESDPVSPAFSIPYCLIAAFYLLYFPYRIWKGLPNIRKSIRDDLARDR